MGYTNNHTNNVDLNPELLIEIPKGDSRLLTFTLDGENPGYTKALFTVKGYGKVLIERILDIVDNEVTTFLESSDTNIRTGDYAWDLRLIMGDQIKTPERPAILRIVEVVGDAERALETKQ